MALQLHTASGGMVMQSAVKPVWFPGGGGYTAAGKLETLVEQGMIALGQAMASYAGQNFGKGDLDRVKKGVRAGMTP